MPINNPPLLTSLQGRFSFAWTSHYFKYLGILLTSSYNTFYETNYTPLFTNIKALLKLWSTYHISFLGRITAIKMALLPKLLFYFRAFPIQIPKNTLDSLHREINKCIWLSKKPKFGYSLMHRSQSNGGLSLPNLWCYYLAARFT